MPSDARILREEGPEALRAYWREKSRRYYAASPEQRRQRNEASRRWRALHPKQPKTHPCVSCGRRVRALDQIECRECRRRQGILRTCLCGVSFRVQQWKSRQLYCSVEHRKHYRTQRDMIGRSCRIVVKACSGCHRPFTSQRGPKWCPDCYNREFQRETRATAIRYWRIADTPEARALAQTYFQLRQLLRSNHYGR